MVRSSAPLMGFLCALSLAAFSRARGQTTNPQLVRQLIREGAQFLQHDQLAEAEDRFRKATEADPNDADAANDLGVVLRRRKNFAEAIKVLESALRLRPKETRI